MNGLGLLALMQAHSALRQWDQPTAGDWADVLATFPLFTGISKRRLRKLARHATLAEFARHETISFAGDRDDSLHVILGGDAKAMGRTLGTGDYFGEVALIDGGPWSATVVATSYVHVMKLPARSVLRLARRHPALTLTMLENVTTQLRRLETGSVGAT